MRHGAQESWVQLHSMVLTRGNGTCRGPNGLTRFLILPSLSFIGILVIERNFVGVLVIERNFISFIILQTGWAERRGLESCLSCWYFFC